jgi:hypothetical protein
MGRLLRRGLVLEAGERAMSEMVERVARAIQAQSGHQPATDEGWNRPENTLSVQNFRRMAKAAIEAMREPTEDMIQAGIDGPVGDTEGKWQAMIDEALK